MNSRLVVLCACAVAVLGADAPKKTNSEQVIGLLFVSKSESSEVHGEIFPVARIVGSRYEDASVEAEDPKKAADSVLQRVRSFAVLSEDRSLGRFEVDQVKTDGFMCNVFAVGSGKLHGPKTLDRVFHDLVDETHPNIGFASSKYGTFDEKWVLALAFSVPPPQLPLIPKLSPEVLKKRQDQLLQMGRETLTKRLPEMAKSEGVENPQTAGEPRVAAMAVRDLDRDGKEEIWATVAWDIRETAESEKTPFTHTAYASLWVSFKDGKDEMLFEDVDLEVEGSWGVGLVFRGAADVDGDGLDEVLLERSGYEVARYELYHLENGLLEKVFSGAEYGC